jgi:hypothetical protein
MGRSLRLVVAMIALALTLVSATTRYATGGPNSAGRAASEVRVVPGAPGPSCPLDTSRCTPAVPTGPVGVAIVVGAAFLAGGLMLEQVGRWVRRRRSLERLATGVFAPVVRPPKVHLTYR